MQERHESGSDMPKPRRKQPQPQPLPPTGRASSLRKPYADDASDTAEFVFIPAEDYPETDNAPSRRRKPSPGRAQAAPQRRQPPPASSDDYIRASARQKRRKRRNPFGRFVRRLVVLIAVVFAIYSAAALTLINRLEKVPAGTRTYTKGTLAGAHVRTVLLIGTDSRDLTVERGRSDSMILLTLNSLTQEIGMNSFMRDAYVEIPGHGKNKLNAAYSLGGAELLMDTLEQNYDVSVDDYVCVSFTGFAGIIDAFGGVEITLSPEEAQAVNVILQSEVNALMGDDPMADFLPDGGTYVLNGKQALSYSRIRYVGNADFERTSRQREVMAQLISNAKTNMISAVPELMQSALPNVATNMSTTELYLLSLRVPLLLGYDMMQQQIPADGTWSGATIDGQSVLQVDFPANTQLLRETAYASTKPTTEEAQ